MSCRFYPYCVDCKSRLDALRRTNRVEGVRELVELAPLIAAALELNRSGIRLFTEWDDESLDVEWFAAHAGHNLNIIDEYGVIDGQCRKRWTCSHGGTFPCELADKHEGPCGKKASTSEVSE